MPELDAALGGDAIGGYSLYSATLKGFSSRFVVPAVRASGLIASDHELQCGGGRDIGRETATVPTIMARSRRVGAGGPACLMSPVPVVVWISGGTLVLVDQPAEHVDPSHRPRRGG
jgi:hypothetical protein